VVGRSPGDARRALARATALVLFVEHPGSDNQQRLPCGRPPRRQRA
jgi:hypothetical protein